MSRTVWESKKIWITFMFFVLFLFSRFISTSLVRLDDSIHRPIPIETIRIQEDISFKFEKAVIEKHPFYSFLLFCWSKFLYYNPIIWNYPVQDQSL